MLLFNQVPKHYGKTQLMFKSLYANKIYSAFNVEVTITRMNKTWTKYMEANNKIEKFCKFHEVGFPRKLLEKTRCTMYMSKACEWKSQYKTQWKTKMPLRPILTNDA